MENSNLTRILVIVALVLLAGFGVFHLITINKPEPISEIRPETVYTRGPVVTGSINIPSGDFISYPINLNRRGILRGKMESPKEEDKVETFLLDDANFTLWKENKEFESVIKTGFLSRIEINKTLEPGIYHLVFSGRANKEKDVSAEASFVIE